MRGRTHGRLHGERPGDQPGTAVARSAGAGSTPHRRRLRPLVGAGAPEGPSAGRRRGRRHADRPACRSRGLAGRRYARGRKRAAATSAGAGGPDGWRPGAVGPGPRAPAPESQTRDAGRGGGPLRLRRGPRSGTTAASCAIFRIGASTTGSWRGRAWGWPGWAPSPPSSSRGRRPPAWLRPSRCSSPWPRPACELWVAHNPYWSPGARPARDAGLGACPGGSRGQPQLRDAPGVTPSSGRGPHVRAGLGPLGAHARVRLLRRPGWIGGGVQDRHLHHRPRLDQAAPAVLRRRERGLRRGCGPGDATGCRGRRRRTRVLHAQPARQHAGRLDHGVGLSAHRGRPLPLPRPRAGRGLSPVALPRARPPVFRAVVLHAAGGRRGLGGALARPLLARVALPPPARGAVSRDRPLVGRLQVPVHRRVLHDHEHGRRQRVDRALAGAEQVPVADGGRELLRMGR